MQVNIFFFATPTTWVALQWEGTYSNNIERIQWGCSMDPHHHHHKEKKHVPASKRTTGPGVLYWKSLCMWDSLKSCADQTAETFSVEESARWRAAPTRHHALQAPTDRLPIATHCTLHPSLALCSLLWVSRFPFLLHPITLIDRLCCFRSDHKKTLQTLAKLRTRNCALAIAVNRYWVVEFLCNKPLSSQAVIWDVSRPNQSELFGYFYAFLRDLLYYQWYYPIFGFYGLHNWHLTHRKTFLFKFTDSNNIQVHHWKIFQLSNVDRVYFQFRKTTVTHKWNWTKFLMLFFFSLQGWQVENPWCFYLVRFPMNLRQGKPTWSSASRWVWPGGRRDFVAGNPVWPKRCGSRCASASWSVGISSGMNAGTAVWTAVEAFWKEVSHSFSI